MAIRVKFLTEDENENVNVNENENGCASGPGLLASRVSLGGGHDMALAGRP